MFIPNNAWLWSCIHLHSEQYLVMELAELYSFSFLTRLGCGVTFTRTMLGCGAAELYSFRTMLGYGVVSFSFRTIIGCRFTFMFVPNNAYVWSCIHVHSEQCLVVAFMFIPNNAWLLRCIHFHTEQCLFVDLHSCSFRTMFGCGDTFMLTMFGYDVCIHVHLNNAWL